MAQKACPEDNTHIVLKRPHTVLLLASMREGSAQRGAYTDAMAEEFKRADGRSIADMHQNAVAEMTKKYGEDQTPEIRSTLKKKLVLHRAVVSLFLVSLIIKQIDNTSGNISGVIILCVRLVKAYQGHSLYSEKKLISTQKLPVLFKTGRKQLLVYTKSDKTP